VNKYLNCDSDINSLADI